MRPKSRFKKESFEGGGEGASERAMGLSAARGEEGGASGRAGGVWA